MSIVRDDIKLTWGSSSIGRMPDFQSGGLRVRVPSTLPRVRGRKVKLLPCQGRDSRSITGRARHIKLNYSLSDDRAVAEELVVYVDNSAIGSLNSRTSD